jgi:hypothetical protein
MNVVQYIVSNDQKPVIFVSDRIRYQHMQSRKILFYNHPIVVINLYDHFVSRVEVTRIRLDVCIRSNSLSTHAFMKDHLFIHPLKQWL